MRESREVLVCKKGGSGLTGSKQRLKQSKAGTRVSDRQPDQSGRDEMHGSTYISGGMWTRCFRHPGRARRRRQCSSVPALCRHPRGDPGFSTCRPTTDTGVNASTASPSVVECRKVLGALQRLLFLRRDRARL